LQKQFYSEQNIAASTLPGIACIDPAKESIEKALLSHTNGDMPSVIFDATGNLSAIHGSMQCLSHAGKYVLVGLQQGDILVSHPQFHKREATLMSSRNATTDDFNNVIEILRGGHISVDKMITHRLNFEKHTPGFSIAVQSKKQFDQSHDWVFNTKDSLS